MALIYLAYYAVIGAWHPYLALYLSSKGLDTSQIGLLLAVPPAVTILTQTSWGIAADRWGIRRLLLAAVLPLAVLTSVFFGLASGLLALAVTLALWSTAKSAIGPLVDSMAVQAAEQAGRTFAAYRLFGSLGFAVASIAFGWLFRFTGVGMMVWTVAAGLALIWCIMAVLPGVPQRNKESRQRPSLAAAWQLLRSPGVLPALGLIFVLSVGWGMAGAYFPIYVKHHLGGSEQTVGMAWGVTGFSEVPAMLLLSRLAWRPPVFLALSCLFLLLQFALMQILPGPEYVPLLGPLTGFAFAFFWPSAVPLMASLTPPHLRATGQSILSTIGMALANMTASILGGAWIAAAGLPRFYWLPMAVVSLAALGFLLQLRPAPPLRRENAS